jgi:tetratricopeptide (TPR) repeat protein
MRSLHAKPISLGPDPIPPTLRDGEPNPRVRSDVVPKLAEAAAVPTLTGIVERSPTIIESLATAAAEHVARGEREEALRTIADAVDLLEDVKDRRLAVRSLLTIGEALTSLGLFERAEPRLAEALALADAAGESVLGARARAALGRVLLGLGDASCRGMLEDAGEMFEELGDTQAVLAIDRLLRIASTSFEETPRSFHGSRRV